MEIIPSLVFSDHLIIERQIAESYYAALYRGKKQESNEAVLIRYWKQASSKSEAQRVGIKQEVDALCSLSHPSILPVLQWDQQEKGISLVYAYPQAGSLHLRLSKHPFRPLPLDEACLVLRQVADALASGHQQQIIHGELTPDTVFFTEKNRAALAYTRVGAIMATIPDYSPLQLEGLPRAWYMAPEQFRGVVNEQTDQYALGCLAYMMLTGRVPLPGYTRVTLQRKHQNEIPRSLIFYNKHIPPPLESIILKTLSKQPERRYSSLQEFLLELDRVLIEYALLPEDELLLLSYESAAVNQQVAESVTTIDEKQALSDAPTLSGIESPWATRRLSNPTRPLRLQFPLVPHQTSQTGRRGLTLSGLAALFTRNGIMSADQVSTRHLSLKLEDRMHEVKGRVDHYIVEAIVACVQSYNRMDLEEIRPIHAVIATIRRIQRKRQFLARAALENTYPSVPDEDVVGMRKHIPILTIVSALLVMVVALMGLLTVNPEQGQGESIAPIRVFLHLVKQPVPSVSAAATSKATINLAPAITVKVTSAALHSAPIPTPTPFSGAVVVQATPTPAVASTSTTNPICRIKYRVVAEWYGEESVSLVITNLSSYTINDWLLAFTLPGKQTIQAIWNASVEQSGQNVVLTNLSDEREIQPGESYTLSFNTILSGSDAAPTQFSLNSHPCRS